MKPTTPYFGSSREISVIAAAPDAASWPARPFTCMSTNPGAMMSPATMSGVAFSGSNTPSATNSMNLPSTSSVAIGRSRSGVSTRPRSKNRLISGTISAVSRHLGLDVGGTNLKWAVVERDLEPRVLKTGVLPTDTRGGEQSVVRQLLDVARTVFADVEGVESVGVGMPGVLEPEAGVTKFIPNIPGHWDGVQVTDDMAREVEVPCHLINDARAFALAEHGLGAGRGATSMLGITLGTGVGGGL